MVQIHKVKDIQDYSVEGLDIVKLWKDLIAAECDKQSVEFERVEEDSEYLKVLSKLAGVNQHRKNTYFDFMQLYVQIGHPQKGLQTRLNIETSKIVLMPTKKDLILRDFTEKNLEWQTAVLNLITIDTDIIEMSLSISAQNIVKEVGIKIKSMVKEIITSKGILEVQEPDITAVELAKEFDSYAKRKYPDTDVYKLTRGKFTQTFNNFKRELQNRNFQIDYNKKGGLWDQFKLVAVQRWNQTQNYSSKNENP